MLTKLLFILLIVHYNASESAYEIYKRTNHNEKKTNKPKFSIKDALNVLGKYSEMKEYANDPTKLLFAAGATIIYDYYVGKNNEEFQEDWKRELHQFTHNEINKLKNIFDDFSKKCENLNEEIYESEINDLNTIFEKEKKVIVNDYIMDYISSNIIEKNLEDVTRLNILCLGNSQIGKTTLINEILFLDEDKKGKTGGEGESTTMEDTPYISDKIKHIKIIDTRGMESGNFSLKNFTERYKNKMTENTKYGNYSDLIHCIWYCVSGNLMNEEEIIAVNQLNLLFNKFKVPIIFVYLKPFNNKDIKILKKQTSKINNNFIHVQSIYYIDKCKEDDPDCFIENPQEYKPKNMDKLLEMTKDLALEGIKNAVSSRTSFYLEEKIEKTIETRFKKKSDEFVILLNNIEKILKNKNSHINLNEIDNLREKNILKIIEIIEETLFNSEKQLSKEGRKIIYSIQKKIENLYQQKFSSLYKEYLLNLFPVIKSKKESLHNKKDESTWFGCNDLDKSELEDDMIYTEKFFDSNYIVQIYSMIASFETINKRIKNNILSLLKSRIDVIISDEILIKKLENKIKIEAEKWTNNLINSLDNEIQSSFPK